MMSSTLCFWTAQFLIFGLHKLRLELRKLVVLHAWKTTLAEGQVSHTTCLKHRHITKNFHQWQLTKCSRFWDRPLTRIKSSPLDLLPSSLLHQSTGVFAPVLAHMANLSFSECCFPPAFKTAQVLPLLKKSGLDAAVLSNFRHISNLSTVSKILERLALTRLRRRLHGSTNFSRLQSAYRDGHSTETALLHVQRVRGIGQETHYCTRRIRYIGRVRYH